MLFLGRSGTGNWLCLIKSNHRLFQNKLTRTGFKLSAESITIIVALEISGRAYLILFYLFDTGIEF